jgi:uncharacterized membrane protein
VQLNKDWMWTVAYAFEAIGVLVIIVSMLFGAGRAALSVRRDPRGTYDTFRADLGRGVLLGLEILVAGDIIRTVAVQLTLLNVGVLAALVAIRTFLSWSLEGEIEGRWPWESRSSERRPRANAE